MKKNYYIQGDPARAEEIKAAFEKKGCTLYRLASKCDSEDLIYYSLNGIVRGIKKDNLYLFEAHPGYKKLELPIQPNFNVGDWLYPDKKGVYPVLITGYDENLGYQTECLSTKTYFRKEFVEKEYHLWSIEDAKDGDVLVNDAGCIFINAGFEKEDKVTLACYCYVSVQGIFYDEDYKTGSWLYVSHVRPATKEQRDLLFKKMNEAGYTWDEKKKELKKVSKHYDIANFKPFDKVLIRVGNNSKWTCDFFSYYHNGCFHCVGTDDWNQCIPFEGNETLLGTTDMCNERFINW